MNKERHIGMTYVTDDDITQQMTELHFKDLNQTLEEPYEANSRSEFNSIEYQPWLRKNQI